MGHNTPPIAETRPHFSENHGHKRNDVYHWLRDENWQKVMLDPSVLRQDIRDYLEAENAFFDSFMDDHEELKDTIYKEIRGRIKRTIPPFPLNTGHMHISAALLKGNNIANFAAQIATAVTRLYCLIKTLRLATAISVLAARPIRQITDIWHGLVTEKVLSTLRFLCAT